MGLVTRVVDGDTIQVDYRGSTVDIRLIGIDTPETVHPSEPVECFGPAASRFTTAALTGETVRLEFDVERRDHYGRMLAYVWDEGKLFNSALVRRGFATVSTYPPNVKYVERFTAAQLRAQGASKGWWGECSTTASETPGASDPGAGDDSSAGACDGYSPCLPPAPDYDCAGGSGDGPKYAQGPIRVTGSDPYELDSEGDGIACES
jgi:micrococcal nuclease